MKKTNKKNKTNLRQLIFFKPVEIIFALTEPKRLRELIFDSKLDKVYCRKMLTIFERNNIVKIGKKYKNKLVTLTKKGEKLRERLINIRDNISN